MHGEKALVVDERRTMRVSVFSSSLSHDNNASGLTTTTITAAKCPSGGELAAGRGRGLLYGRRAGNEMRWLGHGEMAKFRSLRCRIVY